VLATLVPAEGQEKKIKRADLTLFLRPSGHFNTDPDCSNRYVVFSRALDSISRATLDGWVLKVGELLIPMVPDKPEDFVKEKRKGQVQSEK
jgi:hypothetical protein